MSQWDFCNIYAKSNFFMQDEVLGFFLQLIRFLEGKNMKVVKYNQVKIMFLGSVSFHSFTAEFDRNIYSNMKEKLKCRASSRYLIPLLAWSSKCLNFIQSKPSKGCVCLSSRKPHFFLNSFKLLLQSSMV